MNSLLLLSTPPCAFAQSYFLAAFRRLYKATQRGNTGVITGHCNICDGLAVRKNKTLAVAFFDVLLQKGVGKMKNCVGPEQNAAP